MELKLNSEQVEQIEELIFDMQGAVACHVKQGAILRDDGSKVNWGDDGITFTLKDS